MDNQEEVLRNDELLAALEAFREEQNPANEQAFVQGLVEAVFVAPVNFTEAPIIKENGDVEIPEGSEMRLLTFEMENGHSVFPIFTDLDAFNAGPIDSEDPVHPWAMSLADYLPLLQNDDSENIEGLALNPFTNGMPITRDNLAYIAGMVAAQEGYGDAEMQIASAEDVIPTPLRYELIGLADDAMGAVEHMHLLWLTNGATNAANYLLVVDGPDKDAFQELYPRFAKAFEEKAGEEGSAVDIVAAADFDVDLSEFTSLYDRNL